MHGEERLVALEILRLAPERVGGLALVDTNARPDTEAQAERRRAINAVVLAAPDLRALGEASLGGLVHEGASEDVRRELVEMTVAVGARAYVRQNLAVMARTDQRPILPKIRIPTKVVVGEADVMTPLALSREIHAAIVGSTFHVVPKCGHLPPIETPQVMADLLSQLLAICA